MKATKELNKQASQVVDLLGLLDKIAESKWPYEQKRRIENLNRVVNSHSFPGKTAKRLGRIVQSGSLADSALLRSGKLKPVLDLDRGKVLSKFAGEKQAWEMKPVGAPKKGIVERMINFPFKHPRLTMFGGGLGLGYWLANKKNTATNNYYYPEDAAPDGQPHYQ